MNFGVVYGLSAFGISQQTGFTAQEGKEFIDAYMGKYPGIQKYIDDITTQAKKDGFVETLNGRRRYVPEINARNYQVRAASERIVINTPIQGTAADIFKIAMRRVQQKMDQMNLQSMMIVQVHDELIFEVPDEEIEDMQAVVLEVMPKAMKLLVPLEIALKSGPTWGDMG
jgi:DNA polymerase-1